MDSKRVVHGTLAQSGPKQSTLFFKKFVSFSMLEEEVHAIDMLEGEVTLAWQTCEDKSFFKDLFLF